MMPPEGRNHCRSLPPDVFTSLPDNVIDVILMCLPCKDAVRTSILSKKWRYHWCRLTEFTLDRSLWKTEKDILNPTIKFTKIFHQLLTLHEGPITKFTLDIAFVESCPEIDSFICFLSRKDIQHLGLHLPRDELYELPSSLFTCSQLRHLTLHNCLLNPPSAFQGFDRLISLELCGVKISSELLGSLIYHCPLLEELVLKEILGTIEINGPMLRSFDFRGDISSICLKNVPLLVKVSLASHYFVMRVENLNFSKFFKSCSALEHLQLDFFYTKSLAGEAPTRLPFYLNRIKRFHLSDMVLKESNKLSCALYLIRSFPYLEYLKIEVYRAWLVYKEVDRGIKKLERLSDVSFNHLREVEVVSFGGTLPEIQLIKLLLAKAPVLVRMLIYPEIHLSVTRPGIVSELSKFWHASPKAEISYVAWSFQNGCGTCIRINFRESEHRK